MGNGFRHEDFIGIVDNALNIDDCQQLINYFENLKNLNLTYDRQQIKNGKAHEKQDETAFLLETSVMINRRNPIVSVFLDKFWSCYESYANHFSVLAASEVHGINSMRLQKTLPGQGYHQWHYESSDLDTSRRNIVWSIFLNDVDEGGETEFLYLRKRVQAKAGRLLIWPSSFTHTHRGNPPLNGEKYLLTGWLEFYGKP